MMKLKHCISIFTKSSIKKEKKVELENCQEESQVHSKLHQNSNIANEISLHNSHIEEIKTHNSHKDEMTTHNNHIDKMTTHNNHIDEMTTHNKHIDEMTTHNKHIDEMTTHNRHIEEITTHNRHIDDNVTVTEEIEQTKNESEESDLNTLVKVSPKKRYKNDLVSERCIPSDQTSDITDVINIEEKNETHETLLDNLKFWKSESEETSYNEDVTPNLDRISGELHSEEYSEMEEGGLTAENDDEKINLQLNNDQKIISENEKALHCVIPILNICLKTNDKDYSKDSNIQKDQNIQHENNYVSSSNKKITNEHFPLFDNKRLHPTPKSSRRYFKGDGYIHLNTCLSGDKPPLPEKQSEVVVKFKESFERVETCHSSLPRRRVQNHSSFRTTSESMLNTIIKAASSSHFPPPIPTRNLCKSNFNSENENTRSESNRKNRKIEARSIVQSSFNENMHSHLFDFQKTEQNKFIAQRKMKKNLLERSSLFCNRDSDGYLICDSWKNEGKNITSAENLTNRNYRNEIKHKGNSLSKITNNKYNQTIDVPSRYGKYIDTQEFNRDNHSKKDLQNLLLTSVPLPKKAINRFHSHSYTHSSSKAFLIPITRSFTSDCATRENPLKEMEKNKCLYNQNSNLWRENKRREHSGNFEVNYLQLDMVSQLSSAISPSSPHSNYSNYKKIDWSRTKALTNLRSNRSSEQDQF